MSTSHIVNDVTQLNPVRVMATISPERIEDVQDALRRTTGPVSVGGGRFSMGGQTASADSLHIDMRTLNKILAFSPEHRFIRVQAGARWRDIQQFVDPHGLSVKIMQTYANFTVGGSLSVNCHGRYVGRGPLVLAVRALKVVLHDGTVVVASRELNAEIFFGVIGGYGALGVVVEAELDLAENKRLKRVTQVLPLKAYWAHFKSRVCVDSGAVFHNADLYAPHYRKVRSVTWVETDEAATTAERLQPVKKRYPLLQYFLWAVSETPLGKQRREWIVDPLLYWGKKVHWRNYEAGYDVAELEPPSRALRTYVLQEYFVPVAALEQFVVKLSAILQRHRVNALNISIRHAMPDPHTLMNWAPGETFAFVLYHKQRTRENAKQRVGVWTRELIDAVLSVGGTYYLPYQPHGTPEQFHRAYPKAGQLFALKKALDPHSRFTNSLWNKYFKPGSAATHTENRPTAWPTEFHHVFGQVSLSDDFYRFLQNVFHLVPEDRLHHLIGQACARHQDEESLYRAIQAELPSITPRLAAVTFALPALFKQKGEMTSQVLQVLGGRKRIDGYAEIGSKGRYFNGLKGALRMTGDTYFIDEKAPTYSPADIAERGQLPKLAQHIDLAGYEPLPAVIAAQSLELVTCYIGLHHIPPERLAPFITSIAQVLRPGGTFVLRDHDVQTPDMQAMTSLAHTVFNAGLGETWEDNKAELRHFESVPVWVSRLAEAGLFDTGHRILQEGDPTLNTLMAFTKVGR